jgi:polysaccharide export outer membrane protein
VRVAGLTPDRAAAEIRRRLADFTQVNGASSRTDNLVVTVEVKAHNSKVYYLILEGNGSEDVKRMPCSGRETVLDAVAAIPGLAAVADRRAIRVVRKGDSGVALAELPVDLQAIIHRGDTRTNYVLQPEDRVYISGGR